MSVSAVLQALATEIHRASRHVTSNEHCGHSPLKLDCYDCDLRASTIAALDAYTDWQDATHQLVDLLTDAIANLRSWSERQEPDCSYCVDAATNLREAEYAVEHWIERGRPM